MASFVRNNSFALQPLGLESRASLGSLASHVTTQTVRSTQPLIADLEAQDRRASTKPGMSKATKLKLGAAIGVTLGLGIVVGSVRGLTAHKAPRKALQNAPQNLPQNAPQNASQNAPLPISESSKIWYCDQYKNFCWITPKFENAAVFYGANQSAGISAEDAYLDANSPNWNNFDCIKPTVSMTESCFNLFGTNTTLENPTPNHLGYNSAGPFMGQNAIFRIVSPLEFSTIPPFEPLVKVLEPLDVESLAAQPTSNISSTKR